MITSEHLYICNFYLHVLFKVRPSSVVLKIDSTEIEGSLEVINGTSYTFQCEARAANPAAVHRWSLGGQQFGDGLQRNVSNSHDSSLWDSFSTEVVVSKWTNHNKKLQCTAFLPTDPNGEDATVQFDVKGMLLLLLLLLLFLLLLLLFREWLKLIKQCDVH